MIALLLGLAQPVPPSYPLPPPSPPVLTAADAQKRLAAEPCIVCQYFSTDDYPVDAIRREEQGTVKVRLSIGKRGRVEDCAVVETSNSVSLDAATCRIFRERARFEPARDQAGRPVESSQEHRIRWALPIHEPLSDFVLKVIFKRDAKGRIAGCREESSAGPMKGGCTAFRNAAEGFAKKLPSGAFVGMEMVFEAGQLIGADGGDSLPVGKGPGDRLLMRNVHVLQLSPEGQVTSCRAGANDAMPEEEVARSCAELTERVSVPRHLAATGPVPDGIVIFAATYLRAAATPGRPDHPDELKLKRSNQE